MRREELEDNEYRRTQMKLVYDYLKDKIATGSMIEKATGVHHKCITWIKAILQDKNLLWEVEKRRCKVTGRTAYYITTNPNLKPPDNQLSLFE